MLEDAGHPPAHEIVGYTSTISEGIATLAVPEAGVDVEAGT